jgi:hypothetical protein
MMTDAAGWYCRVCGQPAADYEPTTWEHGVIALPCGHEQPTHRTPSGDVVGGLAYRPPRREP